MNRAEQIAKRNEAFFLIKKIGEYFGEDIESLRKYAKEQIDSYPIEELLRCFKDLDETITFIKRVVYVNQSK